MKKAPKHLTNIDYIKCLTEAQSRLMDNGILPIGPTSKQYDPENDRHVTFGDLAHEIAEALMDQEFYKKVK